jgi:hypothetical protein
MAVDEKFMNVVRADKFFFIKQFEPDHFNFTSRQNGAADMAASLLEAVI